VNAPVTLGIIGTGALGASIGLRGRELGWRVTGFDTSEPQARAALEKGAIDEIVARDDLYEQAGTVVLAMPPRAIVEELYRLRDRKTRAQLILDVASVKLPIFEAGRDIPNFVATHPLAGSERSGPAAARGTLFFDKPWIFVPPGDKALEMRARDFIAAMGARAVASEAAVHDDVLALTSHLPQLFATVFSKTFRQQNIADAEAFCGPVAAELLRLGNSNAELWREIFSYNSENVARHARDLAAKLNAAAQALVQKAEPEKHDSH
jgi:prephenate dehydrogenase